MDRINGLWSRRIADFAFWVGVTIAAVVSVAIILVCSAVGWFVATPVTWFERAQRALAGHAR